MTAFYISHPEVTIDPAVPVAEWGLSGAGRDRARALAPRLSGDIRSIVCSAERKAIDTAEVLAQDLGLDFEVDALLGEMNRESTGFLPLEEFEITVHEFFAQPTKSIRGWERAIDAQARIVSGVRRHADDGTAVVAHGGVGALLIAHLMSLPIEQSPDQPGLGSIFSFSTVRWELESGWSRID